MKYLSIVLTAFLFIGCSSTRIFVPQDFWNQTNLKIGIAASSLPEAGAFKQGSQGLLDVAINSAMSSSLEDHLQTIDVQDFYKIKNIFKDRLVEKGFTNVKIVDMSVTFDSLPVSKGKRGKKYSIRDLSMVKDKYDLDYLILFDIKKHGTLREYYGFIPLGSPQALFMVNGMLINLADNEYFWLIKMEEEESIKEVVGEWDEEPDYPNLTKTIKEAMISSQEFLEKYFFEKKEE